MTAALSLDSIMSTGTQPLPPRILVYGPHKIGKSSFAASAPAPIFIQTEDGLDAIHGAKAFPLAKSFTDVLAACQVLHEGDHQFRTVVLDSLDWMERLIWADVAQANNVDSIEQIGYGKGYIFAMDRWSLFLDWINALRRDRGMIVIMLAHSEIKRFDAPDTESYDRYQPALHKSASAYMQEAVEVIGFAQYQTSVVKEKTSSFDKEGKGKAKGSGQRLLHLQERPSYLAGSRYPMPATMQLDWGVFWTALRAAMQGGADAPTEPTTAA